MEGLREDSLDLPFFFKSEYQTHGNSLKHIWSSRPRTLNSASCHFAGFFLRKTNFELKETKTEKRKRGERALVER
jgi:hypothetical protein